MLGNYKIVRDVHSVAILDHSTVADVRSNGILDPQRRWGKGFTRFMPARFELDVDAIEPLGKTVIRMKDDLFSDITNSHVHVDRLDPQLRDVSQDVVNNVATSVIGIVNSGACREWPMLIESAAVSLAVATIRSMSQVSGGILARKKSGLSQERKRRVMDYIESNMHRQMAVGEIASVAAMSSFHFIRSFKKEVGETPLHYVSRRRVEEATKMIRGSNDSLAEIAHVLGYASQSHMNTVFKRLTGVTPGAFRRGVIGALVALVALWGDQALSLADQVSFAI